MKDSHGIAYVIADNPDMAYSILRTYLDNESLGYPKDREMDEIKLIADSSKYPECNRKLFIQ